MNNNITFYVLNLSKYVQQIEVALNKKKNVAISSMHEKDYIYIQQKS